MKKRNSIIILLILFILLVIIVIQISPYLEEKIDNLNKIDVFLGNVLLEKENGKVLKIVDGDTIEMENGDKIRLLGINTPEKKEKYYDEAKLFLEVLLLNKTITLEKTNKNTDLYGRKLRYVYLENRNINKEIVLNGLANVYYPSEKDWHTQEMIESWEKCIEKNVLFCEKSNDICSSCINLEVFDYENEEITLKNICSYDCNLKNWNIKDEGRKKFIFPEFNLTKNEKVKIKVGNGINTNQVLYWETKDYVWTDTGDTLFLRDSEDKLVLWDRY